jgi:hypothetical protein
MTEMAELTTVTNIYHGWAWISLYLFNLDGYFCTLSGPITSCRRRDDAALFFFFQAQKTHLENYGFFIILGAASCYVILSHALCVQTPNY